VPIVFKNFSRTCYEAHYKVEEEHHEMRLDQYVQIYLASFSREQVKKIILAGDILIRDRPGKIRSSSKVFKNDLIKLIIKRTTQEDEYWNGKKILCQEDPPIVYSDEDLYLISKPAYMATHPTGRHIFNCATVYFESERNEHVYSVHRLDRETSGIMLLARNSKIAAILTDQFETSKVKKCYFWIAKTNDFYSGPQNFVANQRLEQSKKKDGRLFVHHHDQNSTKGKVATTYFSILHIEKNYSLGLAFPQTGRQHQIRVHALAHKLPLLGDKLYLGSYPMFQRFKDCLASQEDYDQMEIPRHALHALAININYRGERKTFQTELPLDLKDWIKKNISIDLIELKNKMEKEMISFFSNLTFEDN